MKSRAQKKDEKTDKFKQELLARREQLLQSVRSHRQDIPDRGLQGTTGDTSDHAAADYATELFGTLLEKQAGNLEEVELALQKIDSGQYGKCELCNKQIIQKRLRAIAWARLCHDCQEKQDRISAGRRTGVNAGSWRTNQ